MNTELRCARCGRVRPSVYYFRESSVCIDCERLHEASQGILAPNAKGLPPDVAASVRQVVTAMAACAALVFVALIAWSWPQDARSIATARDIAAFVSNACHETGLLPAAAEVREQFAARTAGRLWFYWDESAYLRDPGDDLLIEHPRNGVAARASDKSLVVEYPIGWWNPTAIGRVKVSPAFPLPYAARVEFRCQ